MAEQLDTKFTKQLKDVFSKMIPSGRKIAREAVDAGLKGHQHDAVWIKNNFSSLVETVQIDAYKHYMVAEEHAGYRTLRKVFSTSAGENATAGSMLGLFEKHFRDLDRFFLGLTQGRRPRAGNAFEYLLRELFSRLGYPFTSHPVINGQPDFILPNIEYFKKNPIDCIIFTVKRTLRERWRQIVTEGTRGLGFFLATIDEKITHRDLKDMMQSRITLVVPARIKGIRKDYKQAQNIITFETFFKHQLDPAIRRWRDAGII